MRDGEISARLPRDEHHGVPVGVRRWRGDE